MYASPALVVVSRTATQERRGDVAGRRLGHTLARYVTWELCLPTLFALGTLTTLVLTKDLLSFSDLVINRGFGTVVVAWIATYEMIPLITRTLPFAVLIGALAALGRLKADREILSIEAAGISSHQLMRPVLRLAAVATLMGLFLSLVAVPWANRSLETILQQMAAVNPGMSLRPGVVHEFNGAKLAAREVSARGDRLRGVLLWIPDLGHTIFAERGTVTSQRDGSASLLLQEVAMLTHPGRETATMHFGTFSTVLQTGPQSSSALHAKKVSTHLSLGELVALVQAAGGQTQERRDALIELHRRCATPIASLALGLLAVALSLCCRCVSRAAGMVMGLIVTAVYYGLLQLGEGLIQWAVVSVEVGVWLPNLIISVVAVGLLSRERLEMVWHARAGNWRFAGPRESRMGSLLYERRYLLLRYVLRQYLTLFLASFALLLVGYLIIDVLERLDWFARHQATGLAALRFYRARIPLLASRIVPMALLLATALTVSFFSAHKELIAMRACGISATRALSSTLFVCAVVTPLYFALNEVVVPRTNAAADHVKATEIKKHPPQADRVRMAIWYSSGTQVLQASELDATLGEAQGLSIYELGPDGLPLSRTDARRARHVGNGVWELVDPLRIEISADGLREVPAPSFVRLGEAQNATVDPAHLSAWQLWHLIDEAGTQGYDTTAYRVDLQVKLATPFACLLLPLVALLFAIHGPPFPGPAVTILVSVGLGIGYVLLTGVAASLGYGRVLPPIAAGWTPPALLIILVVLLAPHSRE